MISEASLAHQLAAFRLFGCDGMELSVDLGVDVAAEPPVLPPLVNRCRCGRRISDTKSLCLRCLQELTAPPVPGAPAASGESAASPNLPEAATTTSAGEERSPIPTPYPETTL